MGARAFLGRGVVLWLAFTLGGCVNVALKSLPPPPVKLAYMPVAQQVAPPFGYIDFCVHHPRDCMGGSDDPTRMALTPEHWLMLERINDAVNALPTISDQNHYDIDDIWTYPDAEGGDCEDMALEKRRRLMAAGWPSDALLITTATTRDGEGHAVLIAAMKEGDFVLDNLEKIVRLWSDTPYHWRARQSQRRPYIWLNADPARFATLPQPTYLPINAPLPFAVALKKTEMSVTRVAAFSQATPAHRAPEVRK